MNSPKIRAVLLYKVFIHKGVGMDNRVKVFLSAVIVIMVMSVSFHSVEEIHYFKTFYPDEFTVQETFYAALVELIKVRNNFV